MNLSRFFLLSYLSICIPLMATNPNSALDQQPSFKDRVKDTLSQGAAYVSSVITGNANVSSSTIAEDKIIHLIFMGKTGAGKSTFINTFYNFVSGTKWDDFPKKFPICTKFQPCNIEEYEPKSKLVENHDEGQFASVTQEPSEYLAKGKSFVVKLIDSPGAADTRGVDQDMLNADQIAKFIARTGQFNAICIVLPTTANRGTAEEKYLIEQLKTIIPTSAYKRIFILASHASSPSTDLENYVRSSNLPVENIFYFDNFGMSKDGYFDIKNINLSEEATNPEEIDEDPFSENISEVSNENSNRKIVAKVKDSWLAGHKEFYRLLQKAQKLGKHSTNEMQQISEIKAKVTEKIFKAYLHIEALENTEIQVKKAQAALKAYEEEYTLSLNTKSAAEKEAAAAQIQKETAEAMDSYETYKVREAYTTSYHNTICLSCALDCHHNCGLNYVSEHYVDHLSGCACISNEFCNICPKKCSYKNHRHRYESYHEVSKKIENKLIMEQKLNAEKQFKAQKEKLDKKEKELNEKNSKKTSQQASVTDLTTVLNKLKKEKIALQDEIVKLYFELGQVSMASINFNIAEYYDTIIKQEKDLTKIEKLNRDRKLYIELVNLYEQKQKLLDRRE
jgi:hypothetical protein